MRTNILLITFVTCFTSLATSIYAAEQGGGASAGSGGASTGGQGAAAGAFSPAGANQSSQTRGTSRQTQSGAAGSTQIVPGNRQIFLGPTNTFGVGVNSNAFIPGTNGLVNASSNAFLALSNQFLVQSNIMAQTNIFGIITNQPAGQSNFIFNPTAAVVPGFPQTNTAVPGPASGALPGGPRNLPSAALIGQDRAANQNDRTTLVQIHRNLRGVFPSPATLAGVHFQVQQGVVTVTGSVQSLEQKQAALQLVQSTPNVVQVVDQLQVRVPPGSPVSRTGFGAQAAPVGNQLLTPTGVTNQFGISPALLPTVPTNSIPPAGTR